MSGKLVFMCCYCGLPVDAGTGVRVILASEDDEDAWQQWWAHKSCAIEPMVAEAKGDIHEGLAP